jgi:membrane associated rhomboid family serine protease
MGAHGYVTKALVAINVLMALASVVSAGGIKAYLGNGLLGGSTPLTLWGAVHGADRMVYTDSGAFAGHEPAGIADGEFYRLFTAMFLHYGVLHLLLNMWALWMVGRSLESALGPVRFIALYLLAGIGGNVAAYWFSPDGYTAGASTAIFGLFGALFVVLKRLGRDASPLIPVIVINLIFTFTASQVISVAGHVGGLITGTLVALGMAYAPQEKRTFLQSAAVVATILILAGFTIVKTVALNS